MSVVVLYTKKEDCCGCGACSSICSRHAITMVEDNEGFLYPKVNDDRCVQCKRCISVCPIKKGEEK